MNGLFWPEPVEQDGRGGRAVEDIATASNRSAFVEKPDRISGANGEKQRVVGRYACTP
jgi:hypothetical protein